MGFKLLILGEREHQQHSDGTVDAAQHVTSSGNAASTLISYDRLRLKLQITDITDRKQVPGVHKRAIKH